MSERFWHHLDENGTLRPPVWLWAVLILLGRPWLIALASVSFRQDPGRILQLFYPQPDIWRWHLLISLPAILLMLAWMRRRPDAGCIIRVVWRHGLLLLWWNWLADSILTLWLLWHSPRHFAPYWQIALLLLFWLAIYLFRSRHLRMAFRTFP